MGRGWWKSCLVDSEGNYLDRECVSGVERRLLDGSQVYPVSTFSPYRTRASAMVGAETRVRVIIVYLSLILQLHTLKK